MIVAIVILVNVAVVLCIAFMVHLSDWFERRWMRQDYPRATASWRRRRLLRRNRADLRAALGRRQP